MTKLEESIRVDLIISDIMMDGITGFELFEMLYQSERYSHIPFIFLTAKNASEDIKQGTGMGAINYIPKPFELSFLDNVIKAQLENTQRQQNAFAKNIWASLQQPIQQVTKEDSSTIKLDNYGLTNKEIEVSNYMATTRLTYKEIAERLNVSESTIKTHVKNIFKKTSVSSRGELADLFQRTA